MLPEVKTNVEFQPQARRFRFSVDEYYQMIELGLLKDNGVYQLVNIFNRDETVQSNILPLYQFP